MATTYQLRIKDVFECLSEREKRYAHHLARAAWLGSRIVLRQTSPESEGIYDFILRLHKACGGKWSKLADGDVVGLRDVNAFLEYAAQFLAHLGNYYGYGDRKATPCVSRDALRKMASVSPEVADALESIIDPMLTVPPYTLGYPSKTTQSSYYLGDRDITKEEVATVAKVMERHSIWPENTRLRTTMEGSTRVVEILQAAAETANPFPLEADEPGVVFRAKPGDHAAELSRVCMELRAAANHASNDTQATLMHQYITYFKTGDVQAFWQAQKTWVTDISPNVEHIIGFMESYRDPSGARCEWESMTAISDPKETAKLDGLVQEATKFIRLLPWADPGENDGKGPFEPTRFDAPNFSIVHALAFCNSTVWDGCNLPNYSDIRENIGAKNIVFSNRLVIKAAATPPSPFVDPSEAEALRDHSGIVHFIKNAIHELLGHGTGKMLSELSPGDYNFDPKDPPTNPLTGRAIEKWYRPGQTWKPVFADLANTVEECRATLVSYYLPDEKDILALFGYDDKDAAADLVYYMYLTIGVLGLEALGSYSAESKSWGDQHHRGDFAILKHLLFDGDGVMKVDHSPSAKTVRVTVDHSKIISHGKPSLGRLLLRLHIYRCTADIEACRELYEPLTAVQDEYAAWREIVVSGIGAENTDQVRTDPGGKIVQANTFLDDDGTVSLKVYDESNEGLIQSFLERDI